MSQFTTIVSAVEDVGYWCWWSERLPDLFQLEFGGVQIYAPPDDPSRPPSGILALRFWHPTRVGFMRRAEVSETLPEMWYSALQKDEIDAFNVSHGEFALNDEGLYRDVLKGEHREVIHFQDDAREPLVRCAFWAGPVGIRIEAERVSPVPMKGEVDLSVIESMHGAWWEYWREYWKRRDSASPLPRDYACEVAIPSGGE